MTLPDPCLVLARDLVVRLPDRPLFEGLSFAVGPGLTLVRGGEGRGKTTLLRLLAGQRAPDGGALARHAATVYGADPSDPADEGVVARAWLDARRASLPAWDPGLAEALIDDLALGEHIDKPLYMLSTGSRRKVGLVAAFAGGADLALLDMPYAALDSPSRAVLTELLDEAAEHPRRAFVVADYEVPDALAGRGAVIDLGD